MSNEGAKEGRPRLWTPSFCAVAAGNFLLFFSFYLLLPILPMYVGETFGADKALTGMVLASYTIMALLVRPVSGYMVDSFPRKKLLIICYTIFFAYIFNILFFTDNARIIKEFFIFAINYRL